MAEFQCHPLSAAPAWQGHRALWALGGSGLPEKLKIFDVEDFREMQILPVQTGADQGQESLSEVKVSQGGGEMGASGLQRTQISVVSS